MQAGDVEPLPEAVRRRLIRPTWVEVDLDAIEHNVKTVQQWVGERTLIGVLKGDACGFGTEECGLAMEAAGIPMLAVGNPYEVTALRQRGVQCPILLFGSFVPEAAPEIATLGAIPTVLDHLFLQALARASAELRTAPLDVFIKIDTGLGRLGIPYGEAVGLMQAVAATPSLRLAGIYSHAGSSSEERAEEQLSRMERVVAEAESLGIRTPLTVIASTPHLLRMPQLWLNGVDPGRLLFGIRQPVDAPCREGSVRSALRALRTRLIQVKDVTAGDPKRYGFGQADGSRRYGVLPFGWADGFLPDAYFRSGAIVRGVRVPFLQRLSTEHSVVDLTHVPEARAGDCVTLLGGDGDACIDLDRFAAEAGVLVSEVTRRFHRHLPYVYFQRGLPVRVKTLTGEYAAPF